MNADPCFRDLGTCDVRVGIQVDGAYYLVAFQAFACTEARRITAAEAETCDFVLEMSGEQWREMVESIRANDGADRRHTLNSLDLPGVRRVRPTADYGDRDKFYRYNQSLQFFFDAAAKIETEFAR